MLVALTVTVGLLGTTAGAVNKPWVETVPTVELPPLTLLTYQVTPLLVLVFTLAVNCAVKRTCTVADFGVTKTVTEVPGGTTVTAALPDLLGSATLTAVIVSVGFDGGVAGAVNNPVEEMVPTLESPPGT